MVLGVTTGHKYIMLGLLYLLIIFFLLANLTELTLPIHSEDPFLTDEIYADKEYL